MKYVKLSSLLFLLFFTSISANAQFFASEHISVVTMPNMAHDSTSCQSTCSMLLSITVDSSFVSDTLRVIDSVMGSVVFQSVNSSGLSPWVVYAPVPMYMGTVPDWSLTGGMAFFAGPMIKVFNTYDILHSFPTNATFSVTNPCLYGSVSGKAYIDNNGNCTFDAGDVALNALGVSSSANLFSSSVSTYTTGALTNVSGSYNMTVQQSWMTNYNVNISPLYAFLFPASPCFTTSYSFTTLPQINVDFPLECTGNVDVATSMCCPVAIRANAPFFVHPSVSNIGCDSISGQLTLIKDHRTIYNPVLSLVPPTYVSGDTLTWDYTNLCNLTGGAYWNSLISAIHLTPDMTVHAGDTLCFHLYTGVPSNDIYAPNNQYNVCLPVVYSYDPNIKEVTPKGNGPEGFIPDTTDLLTYNVHFQNTGTAPAYDVNIIDTLDSDVDPASIHILGTSHNMTPEWLAPGVVKFHFNSIILMDSATDEPNSHGMVSFSVKPHTGLTPGTQLKNKAYIYFDLNPPVITNTALNTIASNTISVATAPANSTLKLYPNPAYDDLYIEGVNGNFSISNVTGVTILSTSCSGKITVDISKLAPGIYIFKANNTVTRFVKQ